MNKSNKSIGFLTKLFFFNMLFISISNAQEIQINDLSFKSIMRGLYSGQMININLEASESLPSVGLRIDDKVFLATQHPVMEYKNAQNQNRYIFMIEKQEVIGDNVIECHACGSIVDLYIFEKLANQQYRLVSRSVPSDQSETSGSWGTTDIGLSTIIESIQMISADTVGGFFESSFCQMGSCSGSLYILALNESDYIEIDYIDEIQGDNTGQIDESSPLSFSYSASYKILLDTSTSGRFPIELVFEGDRDIDENIINYNVIKKFIFDPITNKYSLDRTTPYHLNNQALD